MNIYYFDPSLKCFSYHFPFTPLLSLCVLGLFYIHTLPFNSLSHPSCLSFSLTHPSFCFFPFASSLFNISLPCPPTLLSPPPHFCASHLQLKPAVRPQSWSCGACTQSCPRSKVPIGNTRIRVAGCTC